RLLYWPAILRLGCDCVRLPMAKVKIHPARAVDLRCDRLRLVRLLRHRLSHFSRLRKISKSLLVRLTDGAFRTGGEFLASVQGIAAICGRHDAAGNSGPCTALECLITSAYNFMKTLIALSTCSFLFAGFVCASSLQEQNKAIARRAFEEILTGG